MENNGKEGKITETSVTNPENVDTIETEQGNLFEEIEKAMEELEETEAKAAPADDSRDEPTPAEEEATVDEPKEETPPAAIDDALVERAVKAGISLSDAKSFASSEVLSRIVDSIEAKGKGAQGADGGGDGDSAAGAGHEESVLPAELSEEDGYDPGIVAAFNGMRKMLQQQNETIANLSRERATKERDSYFDSLVGTLDEPVRKGLDDSSRKRLRDQFDVLVSGYVSLGMEKNIDDVFKEAAKIALGAEMAKASSDRRAEALEKRKSLALARPGGEGGARTTKGNDDGDEAELVAILNQKFG